ncbi:hypothetical protein [Kineococcus sp. SYSU DK003]|uniref:hypothetical protein n=1 Tax=Kineococcus sp. SYSU DK003 TaxID=3383124 RepID=UPI003D7EC31E
MSDERSTEHLAEQPEGRRRPTDRRSLIDLTRAERGEPERRRLPGVERRSTPQGTDTSDGVGDGDR